MGLLVGSSTGYPFRQIFLGHQNKAKSRPAKINLQFNFLSHTNRLKYATMQTKIWYLRQLINKIFSNTDISDLIFFFFFFLWNNFIAGNWTWTHATLVQRHIYKKSSKWKFYYTNMSMRNSSNFTKDCKFSLTFQKWHAVYSIYFASIIMILNCILVHIVKK